MSISLYFLLEANFKIIGTVALTSIEPHWILPNLPQVVNLSIRFHRLEGEGGNEGGVGGGCLWSAYLTFEGYTRCRKMI